MISGGKGDVILREVSEFSSEGGGELRSSVRDHFRVKSELGEIMTEKELGNSGSIYVFCAGAINYPLCKAMVYHNHD